jgi:TonB-dependent starch-binding outer membrane protein SusC
MTTRITKLPIYWIILFLFPIALSSQKTISGSVKDNVSKEPLVGCSVIEENSTNGTLTDIDGNFSLIIQDKSTFLTFSFTGYPNLKITITDTTSWNIELQANTKLLDEIVMAYGPTDANITLLPMTNVSNKNLNVGYINDPIQLLRGRAVGLEIIRLGNDPKGEFYFRNRGVNTIMGNTAPGYALDGAPITNLNLIDPMDVEAATYYRDGSPFGIRGINGVAAFASKSRNNTPFSYNSMVITENIVREIPILGKDEYLQQGGINLGSDNDWRRLVTRNALSQMHNLTGSGNWNGGEWRISGTFRQVQGVLKNSGFDQFNTRIHLKQTLLNNRLTFNFNGGLTSRTSDIGNAESYKYAHRINPTAPIKEGDKFFIPTTFDTQNPVALIEENWKKQKQIGYVFTLNTTLNIAKGLNAKLTLSRESQNYITTDFKSQTQIPYIDSTYSKLGQKENKSVINSFVNTNLSYEKNWGQFRLHSSVGYEFQKIAYNAPIEYRINFKTPVTSIEDYNNGELWTQEKGRIKSVVNDIPMRYDHTLASFYGRLGADFNQTFFAHFLVRKDGSSWLGADAKWVNQMSFGGGIALDKFLNLSKVGINQLKLRIANSQTSATPSEPYLAVRLVQNYFGQYLPLDNQGNVLQTIKYDKQPNPNLTAERKNEWNVGFNFAAWNNRITGSLDFYTNTVSQIIQRRYVPELDFANGNSIYENSYTVQNQGRELSINALMIDKPDLSWNLGLVLSQNTSKAVYLGNQSYEIGSCNCSAFGGYGKIEIVNGESLGRIIAPTVKEFGNKSYILKDLNGDNIINDKDNSVVGGALPTASFAVSNTLRMGAFDFNLLLRGYVGHSIVNTYRLSSEVDAPIKNGLNVVRTKLYQKGLDFPQYSNLAVEDASFVNVDNLTIGYNFLLKKGLAKVRVYLSSNNLHTVTNYTGNNPEPRFIEMDKYLLLQKNALDMGSDSRETHPMTRSFALGVSVGF